MCICVYSFEFSRFVLLSNKCTFVSSTIICILSYNCKLLLSIVSYFTFNFQTIVRVSSIFWFCLKPVSKPDWISLKLSAPSREKLLNNHHSNSIHRGTSQQVTTPARLVNTCRVHIPKRIASVFYTVSMLNRHKLQLICGDAYVMPISVDKTNTIDVYTYWVSADELWLRDGTVIDGLRTLLSTHFYWWWLDQAVIFFLGTFYACI